MNDTHWATANADGRSHSLSERPATEPLVSFSHFLPRQELLPEKRFLLLPTIPKASGSPFLAARIAALAPSMHCFGHSHFGWDATLDGVRYVQAALSNPEERLVRWHTLAIGSFGLDGPLIIWSSTDGFPPHMHCRWSAFYEHHPRTTVADGRTEFQMARYAARFARTDKRAIVIDPDFSHEDGAGATAGMRSVSRDPVLREHVREDAPHQRWPQGVWRAGANPL